MIIILHLIFLFHKFATNSGFGGLHNAVLGLAARTIGSSKWIESIRPSDETEVSESETRLPGLLNNIARDKYTNPFPYLKGTTPRNQSLKQRFPEQSKN